MIDRAAEFLYLNARLLERHRFAHRFEGASAEPVVRALRAYRNDDDGGFGHGIEPDLRGPASQPAGAQSALEVLHECGAHDDPMIEPAAAFLDAITRPDGGVPFVLPTALDHPRGPWWQPADASSLTQTAANAAALNALGRGRPAMDDFVWRRAEAADFLDSAYDTRFTIAFLDATADAARAERTLDALRPRIGEVVGADPAAPTETHSALEFSPRPDCRSRRLFDPAQIERDLDALAAAQHGDGGWTFDFAQWSPAATLAWRGIVTLDALTTLRANGRL